MLAMRQFRFGLRALTAAALSLASNAQSVPLIVSAGTPIQASTERRVRIGKVGQPVTARVVQPVYAFDHEVIPVGSVLTGHVSKLARASRPKRIQAIMGGDFTPQLNPEIQFESVRLPDGTSRPIQTAPTTGRGAVVHYAARKHSFAHLSLTRAAIDNVHTGIATARLQISTLLRSPGKWHLLQETGYSYLPYHPIYLPAHTSLAAPLTEPLSFGTAVMPPIDSDNITTALPERVVTARLVSSVSSTYSVGSTIKAIVSEPLYTSDHRLLLPEGTELEGMIVHSQPARWWRRGGQVRFTFQKLGLPPDIAKDNGERRVYAMLAGVDAACSTAISVDSEGSVRAVESNTRFIAPLIKLFIGEQAIDQERNQGGGAQSQAANRTWRTLAGASGFGVIGSVASQFSAQAASGLSFYGFAWSVYRHVVARGHNVVFAPDTPIQVRFEEVHNN